MYEWDTTDTNFYTKLHLFFDVVDAGVVIGSPCDCELDVCGNLSVDE